jgi:hypothetical protein
VLHPIAEHIMDREVPEINVVQDSLITADKNSKGMRMGDIERIYLPIFLIEKPQRGICTGWSNDPRTLSLAICRKTNRPLRSAGSLWSKRPLALRPALEQDGVAGGVALRIDSGEIVPRRIERGTGSCGGTAAIDIVRPLRLCASKGRSGCRK